MAKEWILNSATNRFQLNFKRNVGSVMEEIRKCVPADKQDWERYYYKNVYPKEHLVDLGKKLYIKITEVITSEINNITEEDCINYVVNLVINRTYDGYETEKVTIYEQLEEMLKEKIIAASDKWDRLFNVDFYIKINNKYIGLQIKPAGFPYITQIIKEKVIQEDTQKKFTAKYGGKVFTIFSINKDGKKIIYNQEIISEIKKGIKRLKNE